VQTVYHSPSLGKIRDATLLNLRRLHPTIRRFVNPHAYPAGLEQNLHERKMQMILDAKARS
jgi:nicotinate phosphoribosyltransferase